ncbi:MAG TPA: hypothetical protein VFF06_16705 [Polyangia bacterium]|nr:hypothetical protein [Polyangia bacterium]
MRTLPAALTTAQRAASAEPYVDVVVENSAGGVRRLDFTQLDATAQAIARHDAAVAGDGSVTRVRIESGAVKQQRVANPASGPWTSWNTLVSGIGTQAACAAKGARVAVVYTDAAGTGIKLRESTDNGATYGAEVAVTTAAAAVVDLAVAYKNTSGDLAIAWGAGTSLAIIKRTSGAFGAAASTSPGLSSVSGVAMTYGFDWDIVVTGVEATTLRPTLWTIVYGDGNDAAANTWGSLLAQQQAESDASITYRAPSVVYTDTYRVDFVEADAFSGGVTRVYRSWLHPAVSFVAGAFTLRAPVPVNYAQAEGLALAADAGAGGYVYECAPDAVYRAAQSQQLAVLTPNVLAASIDERPYATGGWIDVDNSGGAYAGPPAPIAVGNLLAVSWGYRTASGPLASRMADLWIAGIEHRREGGVSVLRLRVEGAWEALRRNRQRGQVVHTADTYLAVLVRAFSRAGLQLTASGVSSRASTVAPKFTVHPQTSGYEAVRAALAYLADRIRLRGAAGATITEPLASQASDYTYGAAHPLRSARVVAEAAGVSEAQAFGAGAYGESVDYALAAVGLGSRELVRDASSATNAAATATATARLRQRALDADAGELVVPPHCGQELLDAVDLTDAAIAPSAIKRRVQAIAWRYDARRAVYEQRLTLGAM